MAIYNFSIALIPKIEKQVGCNENLNGYLPNSQKKLAEMSEKRQKSSFVQAREGKIQKEISICPNFSNDQLRDKKSLTSFARICPSAYSNRPHWKRRTAQRFSFSIFYLLFLILCFASFLHHYQISQCQHNADRKGDPCRLDKACNDVGNKGNGSHADCVRQLC